MGNCKVYAKLMIGDMIDDMIPETDRAYIAGLFDGDMMMFL